MESKTTDDERQAQLDAARFAEDPICQRVLLRVSNHYRKLIEDSDFKETELREDCYRMLRAVAEFNHQLTSLATKGTLARRRMSNAGTHAA